MQRKSRFTITEILPIAMTIVVATIGIAFGLNILGDTRDDIGISNCADRSDSYVTYNTDVNACVNATFGGTNNVSTTPGTAEFNGTTDGITAVAKFPAKFGIIVTVLVAAILIGILVRYLMVSN